MTSNPVEPQDVFIVGAGRAGLAMAKSLLRTRHRILGTWNRSAAASARVRAVTQAPAFHGRIPQAASTASLILLCVTDDALPAVVASLVEEGVVGRDMVVAHLAGALDSTLLKDVAALGAHVGSLHPVASFAEEAVLQVGTYFAVEGTPPALAVLRAIVEDVGGSALTVEPGQKPRYHAALVVASNYMVTLAHMATRMLEEAGLPPEGAATILGHLVEGTARNLRRVGPVGALTGPITRGDVNTVAVHLAALADNPQRRALYASLGIKTVALAREQGLSEEHALALLKLLKSAH